METKRVLVTALAFVMIVLAFGLGTSIGYRASPVSVSTSTLTITKPVTLTQTEGSGIYQTVMVTKQIIVVYIYQPECVTSSGQTGTTYVNTVFGQSSTTTYIYPGNLMDYTLVTFITTTNSTVTYSNQTVSEHISC